MRDPEVSTSTVVSRAPTGGPEPKGISFLRADAADGRPAGQTVRVLMGLVDQAQAGGVFAAERSMMRGLESIGGVEVVPFMFGSRSAGAPFGKRLFRLLRDVFDFGRMLVRERPDVVHLNSAYNRNALGRDVLYLLIARVFRRRVFLKYHGSDARALAEGGGSWRALTRVVVSLSAKVGLLSMEELKNFVAAGSPRHRFAVVRNAVDVDRFATAATSHQRGGLLFIARFIRPKGLADLLDAVALLQQRGVHAPLVCVGDGPEMTEARERARLLGLGDAVAFTGQLPEDDTVARYQAASILVLPTYHQEGFPMTILHGMAAGMAVVTTRIRAAADYLREPEHCLWVLPRNPVSIADALERLLRDPEECRRMGRANMERAREFRGEVVAREYRDLYRSIVEEF
jgi:glycosyltransferase involved in cell wall biosynthesis